MTSSRKTVIKNAKFIIRCAPQVLVILICATIILNCAGIPAVATMAADTPTAQIGSLPSATAVIIASPTSVPTIQPPTPEKPTLEPTPDNAAIWADYLARSQNSYPNKLSPDRFTVFKASMDSSQIAYETHPSPDPEILIKAYAFTEDGGQTFIHPIYFESAKSIHSPLIVESIVKEGEYTMSDVAVRSQISSFLKAYNTAGVNQVFVFLSPYGNALSLQDGYIDNLYDQSDWRTAIEEFLKTGNPTVLRKITVAGRTGWELPMLRVALP